MGRGWGTISSLVKMSRDDGCRWWVYWLQRAWFLWETCRAKVAWGCLGEMGVGNEGSGRSWWGSYKHRIVDCCSPWEIFFPPELCSGGPRWGAEVRKVEQSQGWQHTGLRRWTGKESVHLTLWAVEGIWSDYPQHPEWRKGNRWGPGELCQHLGELFLDWVS